MDTIFIQKSYTHWLEKEGYQPYVDEDGDIIFKSEGRLFAILIDEDDETFFRLVLPNIWSIDSNTEREKVTMVCTAVTKQVKVAKIYPVDDNVWLSVELFSDAPGNSVSVFGRCIDALHTCARTFVSMMDKECKTYFDEYASDALQ